MNSEIYDTPNISYDVPKIIGMNMFFYCIPDMRFAKVIVIFVMYLVNPMKAKDVSLDEKISAHISAIDHQIESIDAFLQQYEVMEDYQFENPLLPVSILSEYRLQHNQTFEICQQSDQYLQVNQERSHWMAIFEKNHFQ